MKLKVGVVGAGSWGTTVAALVTLRLSVPVDPGIDAATAAPILRRLAMNRIAGTAATLGAEVEAGASASALSYRFLPSFTNAFLMIRSRSFDTSERLLVTDGRASFKMRYNVACS